MLNNISSFILILILFITIFIINYIYLTYIKKDTALNENINKTELMNNTMGTILLVFGGEVIKPFAFALTIGLIVGTYSSIFVASPVVLAWDENQKKKKNT